MNHRTRVSLSLVCCLAAVACAPMTQFEWGSYEDSLYRYYKDSSQSGEYVKQLEIAIDKGRKANKVAPGLCAELGYMYLERGDTAMALTLFREEMERFPESRAFLTAVAERTQAARPNQGGNL
jgi:hypothetical protein